MRHDLQLPFHGPDRCRARRGDPHAGASAIVLQETISRAHDDADEIDSLVRARLGTETIRWAAEKGSCQLADIGRQIASRARFSDLVTLPQPYGEGRGAELEPVTESALFESQTPVLMAPAGAAPVPAPKRILLAWNESAEALSAARAALPLLTAAESVHVVVIDPPTHGPNRSDPGGLLCQYLARHDVRTEIDVLAKTMPRVSDVLLRHAGDMDAEMMVMGAYGHSRFREAIFGGATRYMLEETTLPVFMSH